MKNITQDLYKKTEDELNYKISTGSLPEIVYKFRIWNDSPNDYILKKQTIRLSSPFELQADYSETILPIDESLITEEYMMKVALHQAKIYNPEASIFDQLNLANKLRKEMIIDNKEKRELAYKYIRERNNETLGVFCASYTFEFLDQWVYLADDGSGFAVGLDFKEIYLHNDIFGSAKFVSYYPEHNPPKVPPYSFTDEERIESSMMEDFNVPDKYSYEREFRITRTNHRYDENGYVAAYTEDERTVKLDSKCYKEILLGFKISSNDRDEIIQMRDSLNLQIPIFDTKIVSNKVIKSNKY